MTRLLPYGCIKKKKDFPSLKKLAELLQSVTLEDKLGHLFTVDFDFQTLIQKPYYLMKFIHLFLRKTKKFHYTKVQLLK